LYRNKLVLSYQRNQQRFFPLDVQFKQMLYNVETQRFVLKQAVRKLSELRQIHPTAAGLVVASSVAHANYLAGMLRQDFQQRCVVVTYNDPSAHKKIDEFRTSTTSWIVSVGMVAEGTDIPRLRVCMRILAQSEHPFWF